MFESSKAVLKTMGGAVLAMTLCAALVLGMAACGGGDDEGTEIMQNALSVVENDISTLQADFATGEKTGADVKAVLVDVAPHWQAVVDACEGVGADKAEAEQLWNGIQQVADGLADDAGLAELVVLLPPLTAIQDFMVDVRETVGYPEGVPTTEGATTTTEEVTTTTVPEGIDPLLLGSWYSEELDETLTYTIDGTLIITYGKSVTPDGTERHDTRSYTADGTTTVNGAGEKAAYSISGGVLTIEDSEYGQVSYTLISS